MGQKRATVCFKGHVQGVWFRAFTKQQADRLQICGWVRNLPDGSVEALFEGIESDIKNLITICQDGPPAARVDEVITEWQAATGEFSRFDVLS